MKQPQSGSPKRAFCFCSFRIRQGAAAKHFVLQERFDGRLRARIIAVEPGAFRLCDHPRDVVFSVARAEGLAA